MQSNYWRPLAPLLAVHRMTALRAWLAAPFVVESVTSAFALRVVVPATAESIRLVMESLTVTPHVPDKSPVVGKAKPRRGEKLVTAMIILYKTSQRWPLPTVKEEPELIVTGPTLMPFLPGVIEYVPVNVV